MNDLRLFRRVMGRFATGVTVITAEAEGGVRGMTANAFMSGSLSPPLCIISVAKKARLHAALERAGHFGVSMLAQGQEAISRHFAGHGIDQPELSFEHMDGIPVLANVSAAIAATVDARHDCGDHSLFIGHIVGLRDDGRAPLVYHGGKYATLHYRKETAASGDRFLGARIDCMMDGDEWNGAQPCRPPRSLRSKPSSTSPPIP